MRDSGKRSEKEREGASERAREREGEGEGAGQKRRIKGVNECATIVTSLSTCHRP